MRHTSAALFVGLLFLTSVLSTFTPNAGAATFSSPNVRVNDIVAGDQVHPGLSVDGTGKIHAVWEDARNGPPYSAIYYAGSTDGGKVFSPSIPATNPLFGNEVQQYPSVASSNDGSTVVAVWTDMTAFNGQTGAQIFYGRSTNGGQSFNPKVPLSNDLGPAAPFFRSQVLYYQNDPQCNFYVLWSVDDIAAAPGIGIWFAESLNCGLSFSPPVRAVFDGAEASLAVASAPDGTLAIAFIAAPWSVLDVFVTLRLGGAWQPPVDVNDVSGPEGSRNPTVAFDLPVPIGGPYTLQVAWEDSRNAGTGWDIYYRLFSFSYASPPSIRVNQDLTGEPQLEPYISVDIDGNPKIVLTSWEVPGSNGDVFMAQSSNHGASFTVYQRVNDVTAQPQSHPIVFERVEDMYFHGYWIAWQDGRTVGNGYDIYLTGDGVPTLDWCGLPGYTTDGVEPDSGTFRTTFTYCILYRSPVGDPPLPSSPVLNILKLGAPGYAASYVWTRDGGFVNPATGWRGGRYYYFDVRLPCGLPGYTYGFTATDVMGRAARASPAGTGPTVTPSSMTSVDIAGDGFNGDNLIAVGWDQCVSLFARNGGGTPIRSAIMLFDVDYVRLSAQGDYMAVLGNDRPLTQTSGSHLRQYFIDLTHPDQWTLLYQQNLDRSALASQPMDMTRDGRLVAVGTGAADRWPPYDDHAFVYVFDRTGIPPPTVYSFQWHERVTAVAFSADGGYLAVGSPNAATPAPPQNLGMFDTSPVDLTTVLRPESLPYAVYAVTLNSTGACLGTGHGWHGQYPSIGDPIYLRNGYPGAVCGSTWESQMDFGVTESLLINDTGAYMVSGSRNDEIPGVRGGGRHVFALWSRPGTTPKAPDWFVDNGAPDSNARTQIDMAVRTPAQYIVGCWTNHVYFWGAITGTAPSTIRTDDNLGAATCAGAAMTFTDGAVAGLDSLGNVRLYTPTVNNNQLTWVTTWTHPLP